MIGKVEVKKHIHKTNGIKTNSKKAKNGDEEWDKIFGNPDAIALMEKMGDEALENFKNGKCEPGGFGY
jgi:tetrahydromethanopterin S-methyltransferase subunit A